MSIVSTAPKGRIGFVVPATAGPVAKHSDRTLALIFPYRARPCAVTSPARRARA